MTKKNMDLGLLNKKLPPSTGRLIQVLARRLNASMSQHLAEHGLKLDQFAMLMVLMVAEDLTQTEISQRTGRAGYTTTRAIDGLEVLGLVERRDDATSRRAHRIFLTDKGRALVPTLAGIVKKVNAEFLSPLDEDESAAFLGALEKLIG